jgi:hypothetical protein
MVKMIFLSHPFLFGAALLFLCIRFLEGALSCHHFLISGSQFACHRVMLPGICYMPTLPYVLAKYATAQMRAHLSGLLLNLFDWGRCGH